MASTCASHLAECCEICCEQIKSCYQSNYSPPAFGLYRRVFRRDFRNFFDTWPDCLHGSSLLGCAAVSINSKTNIVNSRIFNRRFVTHNSMTSGVGVCLYCGWLYEPIPSPWILSNSPVGMFSYTKCIMDYWSWFYPPKGLFIVCLSPASCVLYNLIRITLWPTAYMYVNT